MFEYLVTFRGKKKLIMIDKKENFLKQIEKKFELLDSSSLSISLFHEGFQEFVEIEISELPDSGKLLISEPAPFEFSLSFNDGVSSLSTESDLNPQDLVLAPSSQLQQSTSKATESTSDSDTVILSSSSPSVGSSPSTDLQSPSLPESSAPTWPVTSSAYSCLPSPLILPSELFGSLQKRLDGKQNLSQTDRSKLLDSVYDFLTGQHNMYYLTAMEYDTVVTAVLEKYPHLSEGLDKGNAKALWHRRLKDKFKNTRKRYDQKIDCVAAKRRKVSTEKVGGRHNSVTVKNEWGVKNFLPEKDPTQDDETTKHFIVWLKSQERLDISRRDKDGVNYRMEKTFPERRIRIVVQGQLIKDMKEAFPILFNEDELPKEMERLLGHGEELEKGFTDSLQKYAKKIIALPPPKKEVPKWKNLRVEVANSQSQTQRNNREQALALLLIPGHLKEPLESLFWSKDEQPETVPIHPHIIWEGEKVFCQATTFRIFAENVKICESKNLTKAFFLMMCSFYVFNIEYPKKVKSSLSFLQKCKLDIHDYKKAADVKVLNFLTKVNKLKT